MLLFRYRDTEILVTRSVNTHPRSPFPVHAHPYYELYTALSGKATIWAESSRFEVGPGETMLFDIGEARRIEPDPSLPFDRAVINFYPTALDTFDPEHTLLHPFLLGNHRGRNLMKAEDFPDGQWYSLLDKLCQTAAVPSVSVHAYFPALLYEISSAFRQNPPREQVSDDPLMQQLVEFLNYNLTQPMRTDKLEKMFHLSHSALYARFKAAMGISIRQYIAIKRMSLAKTLLDDGMKPTEVSLRCGYQEYSTFYRTYLRHYGHAPGRCPSDGDTL